MIHCVLYINNNSRRASVTYIGDLTAFGILALGPVSI